MINREKFEELNYVYRNVPLKYIYEQDPQS